MHRPVLRHFELLVIVMEHMDAKMNALGFNVQPFIDFVISAAQERISQGRHATPLDVDYRLIRLILDAISERMVSIHNGGEHVALTQRLIDATIDYHTASGIYIAGARSEMAAAREAVERAIMGPPAP